MCSCSCAATVAANVFSSPVSSRARERLGVERGLHVLEQQREVEDLRVLLGRGRRDRRVGVLAEHDAADGDGAQRHRARFQRRAVA